MLGVKTQNKLRINPFLGIPLLARIYNHEWSKEILPVLEDVLVGSDFFNPSLFVIRMPIRLQILLLIEMLPKMTFLVSVSKTSFGTLSPEM